MGMCMLMRREEKSSPIVPMALSGPWEINTELIFNLRRRDLGKLPKNCLVTLKGQSLMMILAATTGLGPEKR